MRASSAIPAASVRLSVRRRASVRCAARRRRRHSRRRFGQLIWPARPAAVDLTSPPRRDAGAGDHRRPVEQQRRSSMNTASGSSANRGGGSTRIRSVSACSYAACCRSGFAASIAHALEMGQFALGDARADRSGERAAPSARLAAADDLAALHDHADVLDGGDVAGRVAVDRDEVGEQAQLDLAAIARGGRSWRCPRSRRSTLAAAGMPARCIASISSQFCPWL